MNEQQRKIHDAVAKKLTDEGRLIEAGWQLMVFFTLPPDAPPLQVSEMRKAFFMGAQHLYAALNCIMDPGQEPTDADMNRMSLIHTELEAFRMEVTSEHAPGRG